MGTQFGKTLDLLFITANQIAYPQSSKANTTDKVRQGQQRKYSWLSSKNATDNQGWLPVVIDFRRFKPLSYLKDSSDQTVENHLRALEKKESLLKQFKHHEDFDRINYHNQSPPTLQTNVQKLLLNHLFGCILSSRILTVSVYNHHYSHSLWLRTFKTLYLVTLPFPFIFSFFSQAANPLNHEYFRSLPTQTRIYEAMAYNTDAYQYVDDIKYNFKYPQREEYKENLKNIKDKINQSHYFDAVKYYKRVYGIVDPQPFWHNETKTTQKAEI